MKARGQPIRVSIGDVVAIPKDDNSAWRTDDAEYFGTLYFPRQFFPIYAVLCCLMSRQTSLKSSLLLRHVLRLRTPPRKSHADSEIIKAMCNAFQTPTKAKLWACFGFTVLETPRV